MVLNHVVAAIARHACILALGVNSRQKVTEVSLGCKIYPYQLMLVENCDIDVIRGLEECCPLVLCMFSS